MFSDALDRTVLPAGVSALEQDEHFVPVFDDVSLNLDELNLQGAKRCVVAGIATLPSRAIVIDSVLSHWTGVPRVKRAMGVRSLGHCGPTAIGWNS